MKNLFIFTAILIGLVFSQTVAAQSGYKIYSNARFGYSISYPANLLEPQGEADNGDGQAFKGDGATMMVFGTNFLETKTWQNEFNVTLKEYGAKNVSYKVFRPGYFVISGKNDEGKIFYQKTIKKPGNVYVTLLIEYDESKRATYDKVVANVAKSFK